MRRDRKTPRRSSEGFRRVPRGLIAAVLTVAALTWTYMSAVAQTTEPSAKGTGNEATHTITQAEASALTGVPADKLSILWSVDYSREEYPAKTRISAPGVDGLPIYVFEYIADAWVLLQTGTGPQLDVTVQEGGSISVVATTVGANYPEKDTTQRAPRMGDGNWLLATAAVTALGIAYALISTRKKEH